MTHSRARRRVATGAILCGLVVAAFEGTVVTSAMPTIARELGGMAVYSWVFSAFLLASTVGVLACGKLADVYGRKPIFVGGMLLFLAGSALCGISTSIGELVAFRVVQGLGAGAIQPIAMTMSADLFTLEERARVQAVFTSAWGVANVVGPVIGGFLVVHLSWRWVFLVNVPVGAVAIALLVPSYRDPPRRAGGATGLAGALYAGVACALVLLALEPSALPPGWHAPVAVGAVGAVIAFTAHERSAPVSLFPAALLQSAVVRAAVTGGVFTGAMLYLCAAYVPLWMTTHAHLDAVAAGAALVPLLAGWALGSSFGVRVLVRHGMRASVAGGFFVALAGAAAFALVAANDLPLRWAYVALAVLGVGMGPAASTSLVAAQSAVRWHERGVVTSAVYATRMLGGAVAVAAFGARDAAGAARFAGIAGVALVAAVTLALLAPRDVAALRVGPESSPA